MGASAERPESAAATGRPRPWVVWSIVLTGCLASGVSVSLDATVDPISGAIDDETGTRLVLALLFGFLTLTYVCCGLMAWWHRPASRFGVLMICVGFTIFLAGLSRATNDFLFTIGHAMHLLPPVLFAQLFLAFPTGRLRSPLERTMIALACATAVGLGLLRLTLGGIGARNLLEVVDAPTVSAAILRLQYVVITVACLIALAILVRRRRRAAGPLRRSLSVLVASFAVGLVMIGLLLGSQVVGAPWVDQIRWATFATLGVAPIVFMICIVNDRLARSAVGELVIELQRDPAPADLRDGLARALRDPSLTLAYWLPDFARYVDADGRPVELPTSDSSRAKTLIDHRGAHVALLLHDPVLDDEPALLDAVAAAAGIALENGRLHADLRARLDELRDSRARIVQAGQEERKRLERDLHDGAQQRLVALSLELSLLEQTMHGDAAARRRIDHARGEIARSLEELRDLARGLHPAVVSGHGLEVALEQLAAGAPVPVRLTVDVASRLPECLEVAAFYLIAESLANIGKHAAAASATVTVTRTGDQVVVEVVDDGIGGADAEGGSGLRGLADRVECLEGRMRIWSPAGGGTRLRAELPCAW